MPEIQLTQGTLNYRDEGEGPAVVFIHGLLVNGRVWDEVLPLLGADVRRIVPDLPLGSHTIPMNPGATLDPPALAAMIAELIERLDLRDVTLVGNDTGGALCQLVVARHPERIGKLLLINCDAFENFPPRSFAPALTALRRVPGAAGGRGDAWADELGTPARIQARAAHGPPDQRRARPVVGDAAAPARRPPRHPRRDAGDHARAHARRGRGAAAVRAARDRPVGPARRVLQGHRRGASHRDAAAGPAGDRRGGADVRAARRAGAGGGARPRARRHADCRHCRTRHAPAQPNAHQSAAAHASAA